LKILSCTHSGTDYRALTFDVLAHWQLFTDALSCFTTLWVKTGRLPLYGNNLQTPPYMDIQSPVPGA